MLKGRVLVCAAALPIAALPLWLWSRNPQDQNWGAFYLNIGTEILGAVVGVMVIDFLLETSIAKERRQREAKIVANIRSLFVNLQTRLTEAIGILGLQPDTVRTREDLIDNSILTSSINLSSDEQLLQVPKS